MKTTFLAGMVLALGAAAGLALAQKSEEPGKGAKGKSGMTTVVKLAPQNNSGESGTARLTGDGDKTRVEITLKGAPKGVPQPAHIHDGTCAKLDPKPKYPLENVVDGKSTSEVPVGLEKILGNGPHAINVHKSAEEAKTYVACGDIRKGPEGKKKGNGGKKPDDGGKSSGEGGKS
jgi:hypothetical protein